MAASKAQEAAEKMAAKWYPKRWTRDALAAMVEAGRLTKAAYKRVTGEEYRGAA